MIQPSNQNPLTIFSPGSRELRAVGRDEDVGLAKVHAAFNVANAGAARVAALSLIADNFGQVCPAAAPRLEAIADSVTVVVIAQVSKFTR